MTNGKAEPADDSQNSAEGSIHRFRKSSVGIKIFGVGFSDLSRVVVQPLAISEGLPDNFPAKAKGRGRNAVS